MIDETERTKESLVFGYETTTSLKNSDDSWSSRSSISSRGEPFRRGRSLPRPAHSRENPNSGFDSLMRSVFFVSPGNPSLRDVCSVLIAFKIPEKCAKIRRKQLKEFVALWPRRGSQSILQKMKAVTQVSERCRRDNCPLSLLSKNFDDAYFGHFSRINPLSLPFPF